MEADAAAFYWRKAVPWKQHLHSLQLFELIRK